MAWFKWGRDKDGKGGDKGKPEDSTPPKKPVTIDEATGMVIMIINAVPYERLMGNLRTHLEAQDNIFPPIKSETPNARERRQNTLITMAVNNLHENNGAQSLINLEAADIFSAISSELKGMNHSDDYGKWARMSRPSKGPEQGGIVKQ